MARHREKLLDWFTRRSTITPAEAWADLGIYRLGARIFELRADGHSIHTELMTVTGRDGTTSHPARYHYNGKGN